MSEGSKSPTRILSVVHPSEHGPRQSGRAGAKGTGWGVELQDRWGPDSGVSGYGRDPLGLHTGRSLHVSGRTRAIPAGSAPSGPSPGAARKGFDGHTDRSVASASRRGVFVSRGGRESGPGVPNPPLTVATGGGSENPPPPRHPLPRPRYHARQSNRAGGYGSPSHRHQRQPITGAINRRTAPPRRPDRAAAPLPLPVPDRPESSVPDPGRSPR